jgi:hypothetical protein
MCVWTSVRFRSTLELRAAAPAAPRAALQTMHANRNRRLDFVRDRSAVMVMRRNPP